jgi:hypothetical protein
MTLQDWTRLALWITPIFLQVVILRVMIRRNLVKEFPIFFVYTVFVPARDIVLLFLTRDSQVYSWSYWLGEAVAVLLGVVIVYEVLHHIVRPYLFVYVLARRLFQVTAVGAGVVGLLLLICDRHASQPQALIESVILLERSLRFVQVCLLVTLGLFLSGFGLRWNRYEVGIVVGFGVAAGLDMGLLELRGDLHWIKDSLFTWLSPLIYNCAVVVWAMYFVPSWQRKVRLEAVSGSRLAEWNRMLEEFLGRR